MEHEHRGALNFKQQNSSVASNNTNNMVVKVKTQKSNHFWEQNDTCAVTSTRTKTRVAADKETYSAVYTRSVHTNKLQSVLNNSPSHSYSRQNNTALKLRCNLKLRRHELSKEKTDVKKRVNLYIRHFLRPNAKTFCHGDIFGAMPVRVVLNLGNGVFVVF